MSQQLVRRSTGGRGRAFFQRCWEKQGEKRGEQQGEQSSRSSGLLCGASASGGRGRDRAQGFTLLEVLISVLIFAIGALAVAQMQVNGMRLTANASDRLRAVWLAGSMAERMRANRVGVTALNYNKASTSGGGTDCAAVSCTPAQLAVYHSVAWSEEIQKVLPEAAGVVCIDSTPNDGDSRANLETSCDGTGDRYAIKVAWLDSILQNSATGGAEEALSLVFAWPRRIQLSVATSGGTSGGTGT